MEGSTSTEWKSLFVPPGFKFRDEEEPPKPKRQNKKPAAPAQQPKPPVVNDSVEPPQQNTSVFGGEVPVEDQQRLFANEQMTAEDRAACEPSIEQQQKQFAREMMAEEAAAPTPDAPAEEIQLKIEGQDNGSCPAESPLAEECETSQTPPVANEAGDAQTAVTGQPVLG